ncbi:metallophosphoesterase family protein [Pseudomonas borbori]
MKIGLIADTHNLLRSAALAALEDCDLLIHAGDIGQPGLLERLRQLAPLHVVRGNNDRDELYADLPHSLELDCQGVRLFVVHERADLPQDLAERGVQVAICGHSHKPIIERRDGLLLINPGSAGPRRFSLPITVGRLHIDAKGVRAELIELAV